MHANNNITTNNSARGENFGGEEEIPQGVAISGNTVVVDAQKGNGTSYVFTQDLSGSLGNEKKLIASDGQSGDEFGARQAAFCPICLPPCIF